MSDFLPVRVSSRDADVLSNRASRKSSATTESLDVYNDLLDTAKANLEDRLEGIDEKLQLIIGEHATESESDGSDLRLIREERLSTVKCLEICTQLSQHINQIQLSANPSSSRSEQTDPDTLSERMTNEGLQECKNSLARTTLKLEGYEKQLFDRLINNRSKTANISEEERADIARLRDELAATRQGMDICSRAHEHLKDNVSTIDNYAKEVTGLPSAQLGSLDYLVLPVDRAGEPQRRALPEVQAMLQSEPSRCRARLAIMFHLVAVRTGNQSPCAPLPPYLRSIIESLESSYSN